MAFDVKYFEVKDYHLSLVKELNISWEDYAYDGAPAVDPKRPFGNSWVVGDIAPHLSYKNREDLYEYGDVEEPEDWDGEPFTEKEYEHCMKVFHEMDTVLEILCHTLSLKEGKYSKEDYVGKWELM